jgi:integrase
MPKAKLTDGYVAGLDRDDEGRWIDPSTTKPFPGEKATDVLVWDSTLPRFGLRVTPSGKKLFFVRYQPPKDAEDSKVRKVSLGEYEPKANNVTKARAAAAKVLSAVNLGGDPVGETRARAKAQAEAKAEAERQAVAAERDRIAPVVERYIEAVVSKQKNARNPTTQLRKAAQAWEGRLVGDVRRRDVAALIDSIRETSPATARQTFAALRGLFKWCIERELVEASPCDHVKAPGRPDARDRVLTDRELAIVWRGADTLDHPFAPIIKLLILTAQREAEVAGMAWAELDLKAATWTLPKGRVKNGKEHVVDLGEEALAIITAVEKDGPLLFPARKAPARKHARTAEEDAAPRPVVGFSAAKRILDGDVERKTKERPPTADLAPWRFHDLRRTAATGMAALGFPPHVVERVINHASGVTGGLVGVYQRHEYRAERKAALAAWGAHVARVVSEVVSPTAAMHKRSTADQQGQTNLV